MNETIFSRRSLKVIFRHAPAAIIIFYVRPQCNFDIKVDDIMVIVWDAVFIELGSCRTL